MKITAVETLACDAGWRNYHFVKVSTDAGVTGWSEYDEGFGSPGVTAVIAQLAGVIVGQSYAGPQRFYADVTPAPGQQRAGSWAKASARWKTRCSTPMPSAWACRATRCWAARCAMRCACTGRIVRHGASTIRSTMAPPSPTWPASRRRRPGERGFSASKTNLFIHDEGRPSPGGRFSSPFSPELNVDGRVIRNLRATLEALRRGAGDDIDILVDLNFHAKTEGYLKILRAIQDFDLFWVELDSYSPDALAFIRGRVAFPSVPARRCSADASCCPSCGGRPWTSPSSTPSGTGPGKR